MRIAVFYKERLGIMMQRFIDMTCQERLYGARPLRRAIQRYVEDPPSEELIRGRLDGGEIEVYLEGGELTYRDVERTYAGRRLTVSV